MATDLIEIDPELPGEKAIEQAAAMVRRGGIVAIPTDALYTLVCDPLNLHAVGRIFSAKSRKEERALGAQAEALLELVGLAPFRDAAATDLPMGARQRATASAARHPRVQTV